MVKLTSRDALLVVDMQKDFMPGGALPVPEADEIVPTVNRYIDLFEKRGLPLFFSRDWHPENHISFKENGGIWPVHCVQWSEGAAFHESLRVPPGAFIINKGDRPELEAYSAFQGTILRSLLEERGIRRLFICGVATEYCVKHSVFGSLNLGFTTFLLKDAVKAVELKKGDGKRAIEEMKEKGAIILQFNLIES